MNNNISPRFEMGDYTKNENLGLHNLDCILKALDSFDDDPGNFLHTCAEAGIKPVVNPFWKDLPYAHIYCFPPPQVEWMPPGLEINQAFKLTKHLTAQTVPLDVLAGKYGATHFHSALAHFIALMNDPNLTHAQLECQLWGIHIPFNKLLVWHHIKFI